MKRFLFAILTIISTVLLLAACSYMEPDHTVREAESDPKENIQNILTDDPKTTPEKSEAENKKAESETSDSGSEFTEIDWIQKENHYLVGEAASISTEKSRSKMECMVIGVTVYEGGYVEAGLQEWVTNNRPELVDFQDQACIDVMFLMRSITEEDSSAETMLENLQITLSDHSQNDISYSMPFMLGPEAGDIRPDGYKCYHVTFLCPKESTDSPFLCVNLEGNDKTGEVFFDINVTAPGFDPDQYDKRFLDK